MLTGSGTLTSTDEAAFMPDPLTNKISTWSDKSTFLFPEQTTLCSNSSSSNAISSDYILIEERMPWGTDGGPCSPARKWLTRKMNTEVSDLTESLTVNGDGTFTLEQGTYECILTPILQETGRSRARL
ncbi:MAG: hypothetical protein NT027_20690, partial [Proteobacteria bacterium]|nr:hypothetical protein [Pseudomonadota bacterium]